MTDFLTGAQITALGGNPGVPLVQDTITKKMIDGDGNQSLVLPNESPLSTLFHSLVDPQTGRINYASLGDSIANINGTNLNSDYRTWPAGIGCDSTKGPGHYVRLSGGMLRFVANCGFSGRKITDVIAAELGTTAASSTRKGIEDAANSGARLAIISLGVNDIQTGLFSTSTSGQITAALATMYTNMTVIFGRCIANGITPIFKNIGGYDYGSFAVANPSFFPSGAADVTARRLIIAQFNAGMQTLIQSLPYFVGYIDVQSVLCNADGSYKTDMSDDGLHPSCAGAMLEANAGVNYLRAISILPAVVQRSVVPTGGNYSVNIFRNPDLYNASGSYGATECYFVGPAISSSGTFNYATVQKSGRFWHAVTLTPTAAGTGGVYGCSIFYNVRVNGGTPDVAVSIGDLLSVECDIIVDDGAGGKPVGYKSLTARLQAIGTNASIYADDIAYDTTSVRDVGQYLPGQLVLHPVVGPLSMTDASATITGGCNFQLILLTTKTNPIRILVSSIRVIKVPAKY